MKKLLVTLMTLAALLALLTLPAQAQVKIVKGVKLGLNLATFNGDDASGIDFRTGILAGAFGKIVVNPYFAIQPEVFYSMKGGEGDAFGATFTWKMDYIEIPILLRVDIPTEGNVTPLLYAGPAIGININSKLKGEALGMSQEEELTNPKSLDLGIAAGGGAEFLTGNIVIGIEGRYTMGVSNAYDDVDLPAGANDFVDTDGTAFDLKNGAISILASVGF